MRYLLTFTLGLGSLLFLGCADSKTEEQKTDNAAKTEAKDDHDDHEHESGPHEGKLVELGDEEYHAEWLADKEKGTVTVYILDAKAETNVPIEAEEITINDSSDSYTLKADALEGEPPGQSSRFVSMDKTLSELMSGHFHAKLVLKISGKSYSGDIDSH